MRVKAVSAPTIALTCIMTGSSTDSYKITEYECQFPPANVDEFRDVTKEALALLCE